jgi:hypothetical protein
MTAQPPSRAGSSGVPRITVNMPPDQTPEEEEALVEAVAAAYEDSHGHRDVQIDVEHPEEVDFRAVSARMFR